MSTTKKINSRNVELWVERRVADADDIVFPMRCHPSCCCGYEDSAPGRRRALMGIWSGMPLLRPKMPEQTLCALMERFQALFMGNKVAEAVFGVV
jgi:hypothetical protein